MVTLPVDEINSTDAALVNLWGTTTGTIEYVKFLAGDVTGNFWINGTDALRIQLHFVSGNPFDRGPWTYWKKGVTVNSNWDPPDKPTDFNMTLSGADVPNFDLYAMITGDFTGGYVPGGAKAANANVKMVCDGTGIALAGQETELPVRLVNASTVGAASLIFNFPADLAEVTGVTMKENDGDLSWAVKGNELRIGWNSLHPLWFGSNEALLVIILKPTGTFGGDEEIRLTLAESSLNELADDSYAVFPDATLAVNTLRSPANGTADLICAAPLTLECRPNPFAGYTVLAYSLPADGHVTLLVRDMLGRMVMSPVNETESSGNHSVNLDAVSLQPGVYSATLTLRIGSGEMVRTIKLIRK
jgi:hypothetical protein